MLGETIEAAGEQLIGNEKRNQESGKEQIVNFGTTFKEMVLGDKSPEQIQQEAQLAQTNESTKTPEQLAAARKRIQEMSSPTQQQPKEYEYRGPEIPQSSENQENMFAQQQEQNTQRQSILKNPERIK